MFGDLAFALLIIDLTPSTPPSVLVSLSQLLPVLRSPAPVLLCNRELLTAEHPVLLTALGTMHLPGIWLGDGRLGCPIRGVFEAFDIFTSMKITTPASLEDEASSAPQPVSVAPPRPPKPSVLQPSARQYELNTQPSVIQVTQMPTATVPRQRPQSLVSLPDPAAATAPAKRPSARSASEIQDCKCANDGAPLCLVADMLLKRFPSLCRMAASTSAPFHVYTPTGTGKALWEALARGTLKYGLYEVRFCTVEYHLII